MHAECKAAWQAGRAHPAVKQPLHPCIPLTRSSMPSFFSCSTTEPRLERRICSRVKAKVRQRNSEQDGRQQAERFATFSARRPLPRRCSWPANRAPGCLAHPTLHTPLLHTHLGVRLLLQVLVERGLGVEAEALAGLGAAGAARPLVRRGARNGGHQQALHTDARVVHLLKEDGAGGVAAA